jgi:hypothetical protein
MTAIDYSFQKPSAEVQKAAGVVASGLYLTGAGKATGTLEILALRAVGIVEWFVFENDANDTDGGHTAGIQHAMAARDALDNLIGATSEGSQPRYFAADKNIVPGRSVEFQNAVSYFVGISRVTDPALIGAYGNQSFLAFLGACGLASWFWRSNSTSFDGTTTPPPPWLHIEQRYGGSPIPGTDLDVLHQGDIGQYPRPH